MIKMADNREPPPLFDSEESPTRELDSENLFVSAMESPSVEEPEPISPPPNNFDGEEVNLNDEDGDVNSSANMEENEPEKQDISALEDDEKLPFGETSQAPKLQITQDQAPDFFPHERPPLTMSVEEADKGAVTDVLLQITVTEPQKVGEGMSAYMAYKVCTATNMLLFKHKNFCVTRRFSDFLGLHEKLVAKYLHTGRIIPPAPEKSVIGMTKIKMSGQAEQGSPNEFVEKRRAALERYLNRTAAHPVLRVDPDFREFLEENVDLPKATSTSALSGAGMLRLFNKVGETVNKITYKMDENDPWFEEKIQQVENLDMQLRKLHGSVEALITQRKELAVSTASFARSAAMLSNCEEHTALSRALSQLAEVEEKVEQVHTEQANADFFLMSELLKDYIALLGAIKDVFHERVKVFQTWQHAQQMLTKKRELKTKLELAGKMDKVGQAREEVVEWEAKVERGQEEFENISKMIKKEMEQFELNRVRDFKTLIITYLETLMNHQQQLIKYWEAFLPEAKAIA